MNTKISEIISILPIDLQLLLLQHKEFVASLEQIILSRDNVITNLQEKAIALEKQIVNLKESNAFLESEIVRLKNLLRLDSHNSNKPPSTDISRKRRIHSSRKASGLPPGGQKGHSGTTLKQLSNPDHKKDIKVVVCERCGKDLSFVPPKKIEKRQVFDIPNIRIEITEYRAEIKKCPFCKCENKGEFPECVDQPVQYGENIRKLAVYLNQRQLIPYNRTKEIIEDLCGHSISEGTLWNANKEVYSNLEVTSKEIQRAIINSEVIRADETGKYVNGNRHWLHSASTEKYTYYYPHETRGNKGMDAAGILPNFYGICVHDNWNSYFRYTHFKHALCNAHHLRELARAYEEDGCGWAKEMMDLLLEIKLEVDKHKENCKECLDYSLKEQYRQRYRQILADALALYPSESKNKDPPKRGRKGQSKSKNLLDRLIKFEDETLLFMEDFRVPFDNNLAERDIRMVKLQQKISGCFRSNEGANIFCRINGFISTVKKQGKNVMDYISLALRPSNTTKNILLIVEEVAE